MRKIVCALVVLMVATPACAMVRITCRQEPDEPNIVISYECTAGEVIRCFALDIQVDCYPATITAVECVSDDYFLNPCSFTYDGGNPNFGSCVCDLGPPYTLPGIDSNGVTIVMCSLYADNDPDHNTPPPSSGDLVKITVTSWLCLNISENHILGGVIDTDNVDIDANLPGLFECSICCPPRASRTLTPLTMIGKRITSRFAGVILITEGPVTISATVMLTWQPRVCSPNTGSRETT